MPTTRRQSIGVILFALPLLVLTAGHSAAREAPRIAAAADLQFALTEMAEAFTHATGAPVELTFGSSGNFFRQIRQGAPFEMFFSADEQYVLELSRLGLTDGAGDLYAVGRLVIFIPHGSPLEPDGALNDLRAGLRDGRVTRFAIANPEHAPYGQRSEEALRRASLWKEIEPRLVLGENVSQAAQFAAAGGAEGGIIAYSLALAPDVSRRGRFALIPDGWHQPLRQSMVLLKTAGPAARGFRDFVASPAGRAILKRYGFLLPGETM